MQLRRQRGPAAYCSTESILFRARNSQGADVDHDLQPAQMMPGAYTRSKALAEERALEAAASGFPVVVGTPTMPIGPHDHGLTPPSAMLRHFLNSRIQLYLDFIVNLVDVRDVAAGLILAMERGRVGQRYVLGGESIRLRRVLRHVAEIPAEDLAYRQVAVEDRRSRANRAETARLQQESATRNIGLQHRRILEPGEIALLLAPLDSRQ